ncbi:MAG: hypothetical protein EPN93_02610 [Spirochaetes bacterium]|nr:MAG: hypothetical protein EPN93_02610 [Spirochaetota bacterium]
MSIDILEQSEIILQSVIHCPVCGFEREETMRTDSCLVNYLCASCGSILRPANDDCCVFCSFGSVKCPQKQAQ